MKHMILKKFNTKKTKTVEIPLCPAVEGFSFNNLQKLS